MDANNVAQITNVLEDLKNCRQLGEGSSVHIDEIIQCIRDLCDSVYELKHNHETATIKSGALRHRVREMSEKSERDSKFFAKQAKGINENQTAALQQQIYGLKRDLEKEEQKENFLEKEKEELRVKSEEAKQMSSKLSEIMDEAIQTKALAQIHVNNTRLETAEAREKAAVLAEETKELCLDAEDYWSYYLTQINKIKPKADELRAKISEQEKLTLEAKSMYKDADKRVRMAQMANAAQEKTTRDREEEAAYAKTKRHRLESILSSKKKRYEIVVHDETIARCHYLAMKEEYEEKLTQTEKRLQGVTDEAERESMETKLLIERQEECSALLKRRRVETKDMAERMKIKKTRMLNSSRLINTVVEDAAVAKADTEELKRLINALLEDRNLLKHTYNKDISKLLLDLDKEEDLRLDADTRFQNSIMKLGGEENEMAQFTNEGEERMKLFIQEKELCRREIARTQESERRYTLKRETITTMTKIYQQKVTTDIEQVIAKTQKVVKKTKAVVENLQEKCKTLEPIYEDRSQEYEEARRQQIALKDKIIMTNRRLKDTVDAIEGTKRGIKDMERFHGVFKEDLLATNAKVVKVTNDMESIKDPSIQLHDLMVRHEKLHKENATLESACEELQNQIENEKQAFENIKKMVESMKLPQEEKQTKLKELVKITKDETEQARIRDDSLINEIRERKEFSMRRKLSLDNVTRKMINVLDAMERLQPEIDTNFWEIGDNQYTR